jgi:Tol biopolymer transport system component
LVGSPGAALQPDLSSDGRTLFYPASLDDPGADPRLVRFDIESKKETELKRAPAGGARFWLQAVSPDGKQLAFLLADPASKSFSLQVMPAAGGESRELLHDKDWDLESNLAWTPDERYLLIAKPEKSKGPALLWRLSVTGGAPEKIGVSVAGARFPAVSPDGKRLAFEVDQAGPTEVWTLENFLPKAAGGK